MKFNIELPTYARWATWLTIWSGLAIFAGAFVRALT